MDRIRMISPPKQKTCKVCKSRKSLVSRDQPKHGTN
jgi:hypothetical protein